MATFTNQSKNTANWTNEAKTLNYSNLLMETLDVILMESGDKILLESAGSGASWANQTKN